MASTNAELPYPVLVVTKLTNQDNLGASEVFTYTYEGGKIYFDDNNVRDRRFAGFQKITKRDALGYTDTYYHQGDSASTTNGEQLDNFSLIGKAYREDVRDISGNTLKKTFYKWSSIEFTGEIQSNSTTTDSVWALTVGGGGGSGGGTNNPDKSGGGGGGEVKDEILLLRSDNEYVVSVGSAGTAGWQLGKGGDGGVSSIGSALQVNGGSGGGASRVGAGNGVNGGGGGGYNNGSSTAGIGSNFNGGAGAATSGAGAASGGGAGAGGPGGAGTAGSGGGTGSFGGNAGIGVLSSISGSSLIYGPGGIGKGWAAHGTSASGTNYGRGADGAGPTGANGFDGNVGNSGIVVVRFRTGSLTVTNQTGAASTTSGTDTILTWTSGGSFEYSPTATSTTATYYYTPLISESVQDWEGGGTHKDRAVEYIYATTTGNLLKQIERGEVTGSSDGTYTDVGSDTRTTVFTYSATTSVNLTLPTSKTVLNNASTTVAETRYYYDSLSLGTATKGNLTKEENWISGATYASSTKQYDVRGFVATSTDPRGNITTFSYDVHNLYPATTTNALGHVAVTSFDYAKGIPKLSKDPNGLNKQIVFDPVGRIKQEWQSDIVSPTTLVLSKEYTYTDTFPALVQTRSYLNAATSSDSYKYHDGLGRVLQERNEAEDAYAVKDYRYNSVGLLSEESLPYFSSGSARTSATTTSALFVVHTYDALQRPKSISTAVGSTTYTYTPWQSRVTDANGVPKDAGKDAYGNLITVVEHNNDGLDTATTSYAYDALGNLTYLTDALSNVRAFTYDGISRRLTAQDLHSSADTSFGTSTYAYDLSGNLTQSKDPRNQIIDYTYDALNRQLTENYTGSGGTEVSYAYDSCTYGKGRLCAATSTGAVTKYAYNIVGGISSETKTIGSANYVTTYSYDRLGNTTGIVYPDNSQVAYSFDAAGLPQTVRQKASGGSFTDVVSEMNYAPSGAISYKLFGNNTATTYTYDPNELYRVKRILTVQLGGMGGSLEELTLESIEELLKDGKNSVSDDHGISVGEVAGVTDMSTTSEAGENATILEITNDSNATSTESDLLETIISTTTEESDVTTETQTTTPEIVTNELATTTEAVIDVKSGKGLIKSTEDAESWRKFLQERVAYMKSHKDVPESALQSAEYALEAFETGLVEKGFTSDIEGEISAPISLWIGNLLRSLLAFILPEKAYAYVFGTEDFETCGSLPCSFSSNESWGSVTASLDSTSKVVGADSLRAVVTGEGGGGLEKEGLGLSEVWVQFKVWIPNPTTWGGSGYFTVLMLQDSSDAGQLWLTVEDWGTPRLTFDGNNLSYTDTGLSLTPGAVNTIEVRVKKGTTNGDVDIWLNNTTQGSPSYNGSGTLNVSANNIDGVLGGLTYSPENGVSTTYYDNFIVNNSFIGAGVTNTAPTSPTSLMVENETNPVAVTDSTPEFTATYADPDTSDSANKYRLQVATTSAFSSVFWDSGTTSMATTTVGSTSPSISYAGTSLASSTTYYWRIKFWDITGAEGAWSTATSTFTLATSSAGTSYIVYDDSLNAGWANWSWGSTIDFSHSSTTFEGTDSLQAVFTQAWGGIDLHANGGFDASQYDTLEFEIKGGGSGGQNILLYYTDVNNDTHDYVEISDYLTGGISTSTWKHVSIPVADFEADLELLDQLIFESETATTIYIDNLKFVGEADTEQPFSGIIQDISYTYDAVGNITQITDHSDNGAAKTVLYGYDDLYRLTSASTTAASSTPYRYQYSYNALGNITGSSINGAATTTYTYAGTGYANPHAPTAIGGVTHSYDNAGNLTADGTWTHAWDYRNRLSTSYSSATSSYAYDHTTNRVSLTEGGVATVYPNKYYDIRGAVSTANIFDPSGTLLATYGTPATIALETTTTNISTSFTGTTTKTWTHTVSDTGSLIVLSADIFQDIGGVGIIHPAPTWGGDSFTKAGSNRTGTKSAEMWYLVATSTGAKTVSVTVSGNTNAIKLSASSFTGVSTTSPLDAVATAGGSSGNPSASLTTLTTNDLVVTTLHRHSTTAASTNRTSLYNDSVISTLGAASYQLATSTGVYTDTYTGSASQNWAMVTAGFKPATTATSSAAISYIHGDHLGSTNVTSDVNGEISQTLDYYPYGAERVSSGSSATDRGYIGERFDDTTDLNYLNARYYSGDRGQFISQDPMHLAIGNPQEIRQISGIDQRQYLTDPQLLNSYSYARNNPIVNKDPEGKFAAVALAAPGLAFGPPGWAFAGGVLLVAGVASGVYLAHEYLSPANFQTGTLKDSRPYEFASYPRPEDPNDWKPPRGDAPLWMKAAGLGLGAGALGHHLYEQYKDVSSVGAPSVSNTGNVSLNSSNKSPGSGNASYSSASASISAASAAISRGDYAGASKHLGNASSALGKAK